MTHGRLVRIVWLGRPALLVAAALVAIVALARGERLLMRAAHDADRRSPALGPRPCTGRSSGP
ncbi:MAG TPA: hypothetical protein VK926_00165 [Gaiellaceae bacterium]|nr:hypothetical protein [Gaiellaceae bacterium]